MKYESTILKRLIDTYGVVGNPRYISEIIKEFIVRGKERFPELFTYQADWLAHIDEFGLNPSYTVSYTGQSIYAPNTLERPVKSAILKGQTLVNLLDRNSMTTAGLDYTFDNGVYTINTSKTWSKMIFTPNLVQNKKYFIMLSTSITDVLIYYRGSSNEATRICAGGECPFIFTNPIDNLTTVSIEFPNIVTNGTISQPMIIEYQDGMEKWDISYFEGMQSVQMPVLTSTNEDGTKTNILTVNEEVELRGIGDSSKRVEDELDCLTGELTQRVGEIVLDGSQQELSLNISNDNTVLIIFKSIKTGLSSDSVCISDKLPFKANSSEDFEHLRMNVNGNVCVWINKTKFEELNVASVKKYLLQNPITVQYPLVTESVKTVDLTILDQNGQNIKQLMSFNGGTHFNTGSLEGSLLPSVSVSVETDLEETLKVCSIEGNTM